MDSDPTWLEVAAAFVPVAAAVVTGLFLFFDRTSKRIERIKQLGEIRSSVPSFLNPAYAIEHAVLYEVEKLERSTSPWHRWFKRFFIGGWFVFLTLYAATIFRERLHMSYSIFWIFSALALAGSTTTIIALRQTKDRRQEIHTRYYIQHEALKLAAKNAAESNGEKYREKVRSEETDAVEPSPDVNELPAPSSRPLWRRILWGEQGRFGNRCA